MLVGEVETNKRLYEETMMQGTQVSLASALRASSASIVDRASPGSVPHTPNVPVNMGLGAFGGIFFGVILVVARSWVDLRIQNPGSLEMVVGLRELGVIPSESTSRFAKRSPAFAGIHTQSKREIQ